MLPFVGGVPGHYYYQGNGNRIRLDNDTIFGRMLSSSRVSPLTTCLLSDLFDTALKPGVPLVSVALPVHGFRPAPQRD
jgi:hypothetical protein